ncbi:hypothetical protein TWF788_008236 [Orbilia oligospora]|uniref:Uncharacterized protein n=1 Tax=Orbilia oligospora TaxID=2813651 RepID=A0A7C8U1A4_ORBOL|nr:hypothetical protein TWF788_008236 [Orbilia oligospora]
MSTLTKTELSAEIWHMIFRSYERTLFIENPWEITTLIRNRHQAAPSLVCREWHYMWKSSFRLPNSILIVPSCTFRTQSRVEGSSTTLAATLPCEGGKCISLYHKLQRRKPRFDRVTNIIIEECQFADPVIKADEFQKYISQRGILPSRLKAISTLTNTHITADNHPTVFPNLTYYRVTRSIYGDGISYGKIPPALNISLSGSLGVGFALVGGHSHRWDLVQRLDIQDYDHLRINILLRTSLPRMKNLVEFSLHLLRPEPRHYEEILKYVPQSCKMIKLSENPLRGDIKCQNVAFSRNLLGLQTIFKRFKKLETISAPAGLLFGAATSRLLPTSVRNITATGSNREIRKILTARVNKGAQPVSLQFLEQCREQCHCGGKFLEHGIISGQSIW